MVRRDVGASASGWWSLPRDDHPILGNDLLTRERRVSMKTHPTTVSARGRLRPAGVTLPTLPRGQAAGCPSPDEGHVQRTEHTAGGARCGQNSGDAVAVLHANPL